MRRDLLSLVLIGMGLMLPASSLRAWAGDSTDFDLCAMEVSESKPAKGDKAEPPPAVDLRKFQTSIKNQGGRDSCPYFPPVAALEAAYKHKGIDVNLSVEHLIWLRNVTCGGSNDTTDRAENLYSMVGGGNGMGPLTHYAISRWQDMPYHSQEPGPAKQVMGMEKYDWGKPFSQFVLNRWNLDPGILPAAARANAKYGIDKFESFRPEDLKGPKKFEEVLAAGHEIIFAVRLHGDRDDSATGQPVWRLKPGTAGDSVNHFMLMVGYDRARKFFIVKNQWGATKYTANKLAAGWKDVVKYNGYTLIDYNFLAECWEAHYITETAPVGSSRFTSQRALGQWLVTFKRPNKQVMTGVLCWRRLPHHQGGPKDSDLRIGELVTTDGRQFRVNAKLEGDGTKPFQVALHINFATGLMPADSTQGAVFKGALTLPQKGEHTMELKFAAGPKDEMWGVPADELECTATLVENRNLLLTMSPPK